MSRTSESNQGMNTSHPDTQTRTSSPTSNQGMRTSPTTSPKVNTNHTSIIAGSVIAGTIVILSIVLLLWRYKRKSAPLLPITSIKVHNSGQSVPKEPTRWIEPYDLKHAPEFAPGSQSLVAGNEDSSAPSGNSTTRITPALTERQIRLREESEVLQEQINNLQQTVLSSNVDLQRERARMDAYMQRLEGLLGSDWAKGASDDPPPHYEH
ncbi:hypothetical protein K435DRAFT_877015 [Dendrothele bispora CBS 962.96]|uniref:Uncharacterized protein n=1 Tax=Dendrothele bispora (strain CBS 962.96) TaxID=1314807 RepID=A0A4S8KR27_DENBC|nr:hypothetical protein K435DRAFT_877015 [Dendrothele bispora CBS 962.96]